MAPRTLQLSNPQIKSVLPPRAKDLTGRVFDKWTVISYAGHNQHSQNMWVVECSCVLRTRRTINGNHLGRKSNPSRSCGLCPNKCEHHVDGTTLVELVCENGEVLPCIIDTEDYPRIQQHRWYIYPRKHTYYAKSATGGWMHRFIRPDIAGEIDHRDRCGWNNRRNNLRPATRSGQNTNTRRRASRTGYRGVSPARPGHPSKLAFHVYIGHLVNGSSKREYVGSFRTKEQAARAYDRAARKYHGEFATLNFPRRSK